MTYIFTVKDSAANRIEQLRAENLMRAFRVGQEIIKQGNEIVDIKTNSSDDSPVTISEIKQSLIVDDHWVKEYPKRDKTLHSD